MEIRAYKTPKIVIGDDLFAILDQNLPKLSEKSVVAVTSKIVSICEGRVVKNDGTVKKIDLIEKEAQWYIEPGVSKYDASLSVTRNILVSAAGIDESNGNGYFVMWPKNAFQSAENIWGHLKKVHGIQNLAVLITDSVVVPLRWGTRGVGIAWCGFVPLRDYRDKPDIFDRPFVYTKLSILDCLATTAVLAMGEGNEQTPLAVLNKVPNITFLHRPPTKEEISTLQIEPEDDLFAPILHFDQLKKGRG
ncbi:coenzyme F420-0:L-glutamate ligase [Candidatus Gottesmanbacteria bacterium]|nr:coenzyme F420-0:L-glutamate ligase [Candidatus Gottesmanbacteria bacterium]